MLKVIPPVSIEKFAAQINKLLDSHSQISISEGPTTFSLGRPDPATILAAGRINNSPFEFRIELGEPLRVRGSIGGERISSPDDFRALLAPLSQSIEAKYSDEFAHSSILRNSVYLQLLARSGRGEDLIQSHDDPYVILDAILTEANKVMVHSSSNQSRNYHCLERNESGQITLWEQFPFNRGEEFANNTFIFYKTGEIHHHPPFTDSAVITDRIELLRQANKLLGHVLELSSGK